MEGKRSNYPKALFDELCSFRHTLDGCLGCNGKGNPDICDESIDSVYKCFLALD